MNPIVDLALSLGLQAECFSLTLLYMQHGTAPQYFLHTDTPSAVRGELLHLILRVSKRVLGTA